MPYGFNRCASFGGEIGRPPSMRGQGRSSICVRRSHRSALVSRSFPSSPKTERMSDETQQDWRYFDQHELAERWGVSPRSLERWRWRRTGPRWVKVGSKVRYREQDVLAFEEANLHGDAGDGTARSPPR
jgi:hypothetical protein